MGDTFGMPEEFTTQLVNGAPKIEADSVELHANEDLRRLPLICTIAVSLRLNIEPLLYLRNLNAHNRNNNTSIIVINVSLTANRKLKLLS